MSPPNDDRSAPAAAGVPELRSFPLARRPVDVFGLLAQAFFVALVAGLLATVEYRLHTSRADLILMLLMGALLAYSVRRLVRDARGAYKRARRSLEAIVVGVDGVVLRGGERDGEFIAYADVRDVRGERGGVTLSTARGTHWLDPAGEPVATLSERRGPLLAALRGARERAAARQATASVLGRLERAGAPLDQWCEGLRALVGRGGYRRAGLAPDELLSAVEDGTAPVKYRVAAAYALASSGDDGLRARARVAAGASADARVRGALERAAEGELDESIGEGDEETGRRSRARA
jgi:hypothetical protein